MSDPPLPPATDRDPSGRFVPGCSGNPAGKKPGTQNWATRLRRAIKDGEDDAIARDIVESALGGSGVDRRSVLDRLEPRPRGRPVEIPNATGSLNERCDAVFDAMARGEISTTEAAEAARVIETRLKLNAHALDAAQIVVKAQEKMAAERARETAAREQAVAAKRAAAERAATADREAAQRHAAAAAYAAQQAELARSRAAFAAAHAAAAQARTVSGGRAANTHSSA